MLGNDMATTDFTLERQMVRFAYFCLVRILRFTKRRNQQINFEANNHAGQSFFR